ncbi:MAG: BatA domain-containing protein, partial [Planctomycetota bacterium]|nr:BatA domain-containing protein [Planctomycetota bacterium]
MFKFFAATFAIAGLVAAAGPIIIHLLNRRRFRVVEWAAMDFLRQAMQRSRRAIQLRDLLVLVLRCLAVVIFGAALARPFLSGVSSLTMLVGFGTALAVVGAVGTAAGGILTSQRRARGISFGACALCVGLSALGLFSMLRDSNDESLRVLTSRQPVHAVVLIDNSMSMGYESLEGTLLDRARTKAAEFIDALPSGSFINVLPLCGSDEADTASAYRNKSDARAALDRIRVVDRVGRASFAIDQAGAACRQVPELPSKRVVLISDQQANLWAGGANADQLAALPDFQIMKIAPKEIENVWISDFQLQDGVAD